MCKLAVELELKICADDKLLNYDKRSKCYLQMEDSDFVKGDLEYIIRDRQYRDERWGKRINYYKKSV